MTVREFQKSGLATGRNPSRDSTAEKVVGRYLSGDFTGGLAIIRYVRYSTAVNAVGKILSRYSAAGKVVGDICQGILQLERL